MRLGGWSRIGIILSVFWGLFIGYKTVTDTYYSGRLYKAKEAWLREAAEVISKIVSEDPEQKLSPKGVQAAIRHERNMDEAIAWLEGAETSPNEMQEAFSNAVAQVNEKHRPLVAEFRKEQIQPYFLAPVIWLAGTAALFLSGWTVRWVYRGFRRRPT